MIWAKFNENIFRYYREICRLGCWFLFKKIFFSQNSVCAFLFLGESFQNDTSLFSHNNGIAVTLPSDAWNYCTWAVHLYISHSPFRYPPLTQAMGKGQQEEIAVLERMDGGRGETGQKRREGRRQERMPELEFLRVSVGTAFHDLISNSYQNQLGKS